MRNQIFVLLTLLCICHAFVPMINAEKTDKLFVCNYEKYNVTTQWCNHTQRIDQPTQVVVNNTHPNDILCYDFGEALQIVHYVYHVACPNTNDTTCLYIADVINVGQYVYDTLCHTQDNSTCINIEEILVISNDVYNKYCSSTSTSPLCKDAHAMIDGITDIYNLRCKKSVINDTQPKSIIYDARIKSDINNTHKKSVINNTRKK